VKFKTIKAREGKGLARSIMQCLDDMPDDDDDSFEVESEEDSDDDQWGDTQSHLNNENSDAEPSSDDEGSQPDDESPEGGFTLSNSHQTIKRLQDDLLADEDEPEDGTLYFCHILKMLTPSYQVYPHMRGAAPSFNNKLQPWRQKILPKKTGL